MEAERGGGRDSVGERVVERVSCVADYVYGVGGGEGCGDLGGHEEGVGEAVGAGADERGGEELGVALG